MSVKCIPPLTRFGFMEVWDFHGAGNEKSFLAEFKKRANDIFLQDWHSRLEESTRARFYITVANLSTKVIWNLLISKNLELIIITQT